jgi:hypothetical protein
MPPGLFALVTLWVRSCVFAQVALDFDLPIYTSYISWDDRFLPSCPAFIY